jgi:hypothetical protein
VFDLKILENAFVLINDSEVQHHTASNAGSYAGSGDYSAEK